MVFANIGYARVSTKDQSLDSQIDILKEYGCTKIFSEKISGRKYQRNELDKCLEYLRSGDTLVIYKLDRLGRTVKQLIELAQWFEENGIELEIISMNINTKNPMGRMFFTISSAYAELEADLLSQRTKAGLESARARGRFGGRPPIPEHKRREVRYLYNEQKMTVSDISKNTMVSKASIYRIVRENKH